MINDINELPNCQWLQLRRAVTEEQEMTEIGQ